MTSTVDVNVLVYAADTSSERHRQARRLLDWIATSPSIVYLFWPVLLGYVRIVTHPGIIESPLALDEALADIEDLSSRPQLITAGEDFDFWPNFRDAALSVSARGKLVPDAHLVALMRTHAVRSIWTADRDFRKFDGIAVWDPFDDRYSSTFVEPPSHG